MREDLALVRGMADTLSLPLAAWIVASRRDSWHELLAATVVTVAIACPVLLACAFVEVYAASDVILALR